LRWLLEAVRAQGGVVDEGDQGRALVVESEFGKEVDY
jgi:hypothetical protein